MSQPARAIVFTLFVLALLVFREIGARFEWFHFQPYIALFFALAALRKWQWLALPAFGYLLSSINQSGGLAFWMAPALLSFALIAFWGSRFSSKSSAPSLLGGSLLGAAVFYLVTNTASWMASPVYAKTAAGFTQALTVGNPAYAPTWTFFRNDALATLFFTALILIFNRMTFGEKLTFAKPVEA